MGLYLGHGSEGEKKMKNESEMIDEVEMVSRGIHGKKQENKIGVIKNEIVRKIP